MSSFKTPPSPRTHTTWVTSIGNDPSGPWNWGCYSCPTFANGLHSEEEARRLADEHVNAPFVTVDWVREVLFAKGIGTRGLSITSEAAGQVLIGGLRHQAAEVREVFATAGARVWWETVSTLSVETRQP